METRAANSHSHNSEKLWIKALNSYLLPNLTPALGTTAIFSFIWTWNDFLSQLLYLTRPENQTVAVALRNFADAEGTSWGPLFAMSTVSLIPVFAVFLFGQRFLVQGIATTGLK